MLFFCLCWFISYIVIIYQLLQHADWRDVGIEPPIFKLVDNLLYFQSQSHLLYLKCHKYERYCGTGGKVQISSNGCSDISVLNKVTDIFICKAMPKLLIKFHLNQHFGSWWLVINLIGQVDLLCYKAVAVIYSPLYMFHVLFSQFSSLVLNQPYFILTVFFTAEMTMNLN